MPEHMAGQRGNPTVAFALIDSLSNETAPVSQRVTRCPGVLSHCCQPARSIGEPHLIRSAVCAPSILSARRVEGWRRHHISAVGAQIEARLEAGSIANRSTRMSKIQMMTSATRRHFGGDRQSAVTLLQFRQAILAAMAGIDIEHDQIGDVAGNDTDIGIRPLPEPSIDFRRRGEAALEWLPPDQGPLVSMADRDNRPTPSPIERGPFPRWSLRIEGALHGASRAWRLLRLETLQVGDDVVFLLFGQVQARHGRMWIRKPGVQPLRRGRRVVADAGKGGRGVAGDAAGLHQMAGRAPLAREPKSVGHVRRRCAGARCGGSQESRGNKPASPSRSKHQASLRSSKPKASMGFHNRIGPPPIPPFWPCRSTSRTDKRRIRVRTACIMIAWKPPILGGTRSAARANPEGALSHRIVQAVAAATPACRLDARTRLRHFLTGQRMTTTCGDRHRCERLYGGNLDSSMTIGKPRS